MTNRVWRASLMTIVLIAIAYILAAAQSRALPGLRSQHSQPALRMPSQQVAITQEGKTFHRSDCPFIHGPITMMDAQTAAAQGYVPDPRCMHDAFAK